MQVVSDLHLEFVFGKPLPDSEVLMCAGDITDFPDRAENLRKVRETCSKMIYVLGNHEFYRCDVPVTEVVEAYRRTCADLDITLLENETCDTRYATVYGCTLWTYPKAPDWRRTNDRRIPIQFIRETHLDSKTKLEAFKRSYDLAKPLVVMTHHLPSFKLVDLQYALGPTSMFASQCTNLVSAPVHTWVYGHTHTPHIGEINGVRTVCNPRGYPGENAGEYVPVELFSRT